MKRQMTLLAARLLTVAALFGFCTQAVAQSNTPKPYAVVIENGNDLDNCIDFYYDSYMTSHYENNPYGIVYDLSNWDGTTAPSWKGNEFIYTVTFHESFAEWGGLVSTNSMFEGMKNLERIEGLQYLNTSNVTSMQCMFKNCEMLTNLDLSRLNTSKVEYMEEMFKGCMSLYEVDLSGFNTSNVVSMGELFSGCSGLSKLDLSSFNTSKVINMSSMFADCGSLSELDLTNFDMQSIVNVEYMFVGCSYLSTIYCEDTWQCTYSTGMFAGCTNLKGAISYDESKTGIAYANPETGYFTGRTPYAVLGMRDVLTFYYDTKRSQRSGTVYDMSEYAKGGLTYPPYYPKRVYMVNFDPSYADFDGHTTTRSLFDGCNELIEIHGIENLNTSNVTDMSRMFAQCEALRYTGDLSTLDTHNVTDMSGMFIKCQTLTGINVSNFDTRNVTNMQSMFANCSSLKTINVRNFDTQNVTNMCWMFALCTNLTTIYCDDTWKCDSSMAMFGQDIKLVGAVSYQDLGNDEDARFANPITGYFTGRTPYAVLSKDETTLTFYYDSQRSEREGTTFSMIYEDSFREWREYRSNIRNVAIDASLRDFDGLTNAYQMFEGMGMKTITGLEYLNTSNVTNMTGMFGGCGSLKELDLSAFSVQNVTEMGYMFANCSDLTTIYCDDTWTCAKSTWMFGDSKELKGAISYNPGKTDATYANPNSGYFTHKNTTGKIIDLLLAGSVGDARVEYDPYDADNNALGSTFLSTEDGQYSLRHDVAATESYVYLNVYPPTNGTWTVSHDGTDITSQFTIDEANGNAYLKLNASDLHTSTFVVRVEAAAASSADVNGDGSTTIADVTKLVNIILGKE